LIGLLQKSCKLLKWDFYCGYFRKIILKNADPCGDVLLDEALKHIKVKRNLKRMVLNIVFFSSLAENFG
jgi:hypothetical protein